MSGSPTAPPAPRVGERIYLVDANNVAHRLFHSNAPCHAPADPSLPIHVVLAWTRRMRSLRRGHDPAYLLPIFDGPGDNWRRALLPAYKLARKPQAPELASQWGMIARVSEALGLTPLRQPGLEADDLIAGYTKAAFAAGLEITIVSNDSDLMQLIQGPKQGPGSVRQLDPFSGKFTGPAEVEAKFGVKPSLLPDLLALVGDGADGVPGVPGIGPKIAAELLGQYGDLEGVLENAALVRQRKRSERLLAHRADARLSRKLCALRSDATLPRALVDIPRWRPSRRALNHFFAELGFPNFETALDGPDAGPPPHWHETH